jgi:hypothetical protein
VAPPDKLPAHAVNALPPQKWAPLSEAFARVKSGVGAGELAAHDLTEHARNKRLILAARRIVRGASEALVFEPEFWQPTTKIEPPTPLSEPMPRIWSSWLALQQGHDWHFFVCRAELDKLYPVTTVATPGDMRPPPRRRGPALTHDWFGICGEIARRCIDSKSGRVRVPKNESALARDMLTWCQDQGWDEPAESEMREAVRRVCAALRSAQK